MLLKRASSKYEINSTGSSQTAKIALQNQPNHTRETFNKFKQLMDVKKRLNDISLSAIYCKVKSEIEDLGKGSIGASIVENFYKRKMNPKPKTLKLIAPWVENERRDHG